MKIIFSPILFLFVSLLSFGACTTRHTDEESNSYSVEVDESKTVSFYDFFSRIEVVPLETTDNSLLMDVSRGLKVYDDKFYILDGGQSLIQVFSSDGSYLNTINKRGTGPGEYTLLYDFSINRYTGDLELMSPASGIYVYDVMGKKYKSHVPLPSSLSAISYYAVLAPQQYLFYSEFAEPNKLVAYDCSAQKTLFETYHFPKDLLKTIYGHSRSPFYIYNDTVHFVQSYDGENFIFKDGKMESCYKWNFGERTFKLVNLPEGESADFYSNWENSVGSNYLAPASGYMENASFYFTSFRTARTSLKLILDKKRNIPVLFNRFKEGVGLAPLHHVTDESAYSIIDVSVLHLFLNDELMDTAARNIVAKLTEESNPVVIKYVFK